LWSSIEKPTVESAVTCPPAEVELYTLLLQTAAGLIYLVQRMIKGFTMRQQKGLIQKMASSESY
jgi:hypothetical protein